MTSDHDSPARALVAEFLGTALLLVAIVGSGIATSGEAAASTQLFQHALVVAAALTALILTFGSVSGAHFNPVVSAVDACFGGLTWRRVFQYAAVQIAGAMVGVMVTNLMFEAPAVTIGTLARTGPGIWTSEVLATLGLVGVILGTVRVDEGRNVAYAVGLWIGGAIFATSSAAFANPAVTVARILSDGYTAIRPVDVPGFVLAQLAAGGLAVVLFRWLFADSELELLVPHPDLDTETTAKGNQETPP